MGCSICGNKVIARGWCNPHYRKWKKYGDPLADHRPPRRTAAEIFAAHMPGPPPPAPSPTEGCWDWPDAIQSGGYGMFTMTTAKGKKTQVLAHRISHEIYNGPIPDDLFVLHSCDRPVCCQPRHLSAGTHADNMRDMTIKGRHWRHNRS